MLLFIGDVLNADQIAQIRKDLAQASFVPGSETAGWAAAGVKNNLQVKPDLLDETRALIVDALSKHEVFAAAACPARMGPVILSRYDVGMSYGTHVDDGIMRQSMIRTDLAFTLFLSDEEDVDGGELVIEEPAGERIVKLPAGSLVLYPASTLHRVDPVRRGTRIAAVGWLQSLIRDPRHREILFDLQLARREMFAVGGKSDGFDRVSKVTSNLWRLWAEF